MFVTCFLAMINTKTGEVKYANAGHNPPVIGQKRHYTYLKCNAGFVLGGLPEAFVKDEEVTLKKGDSLTLYTDGITEAMNKKRELYGEERLLKLFNKSLGIESPPQKQQCKCLRFLDLTKSGSAKSFS